MFPFRFHFSSELFRLFDLFLIIIEAVIIEGNVVVVVIVLTLVDDGFGFSLDVLLVRILSRLLPPAFALDDMIWIYVS